MPKYSPDQRVKFTYKGKELTGVIQGIKQGTGKANGDKVPLYFVWADDRGRWIRESWIILKLSHWLTLSK